MKKITVCLSIILILSISVFSIKSREVFEKIEAIQETVAVNNEVKEVKEINEETVRIVIKNDLINTIYRDKLVISSKEVKMYYGKKYEKIKAKNNFEIEKNSKIFKDNSIVKLSSTDNLYIKGVENGYKGEFFVYKTKSGLVLVNEINLNDYIAAVISSEMSEEFPLEALKAQAICARTYIGHSNPKEYKKFNASGDDSTSFQVYNKIVPGDKCIKAANETKNIVMKSDGKLINAYYFSTSCGFTTDYRIWGKDKLTYLAGCCLLDKNTDLSNEKSFVKFINSRPNCYEKEYPFFRWSTYLSNEQIKNGIWKQVKSDIGNVKKVEVVKRGTGGIVSQILIKGTKREVLLTNQNEIRKTLISSYCKIKLNDGSIRKGMEMLPSAFFCVEEDRKEGKYKGIKIYGGGFGHGSGMSQNAAKEMALDGKKYDEILKTFYKDVEITNLQ